MPHLIVTIDKLPYGGVDHKLGDKFFASDEDARMLKGFGKARDADVRKADIPDGKPSVLASRDMKAKEDGGEPSGRSGRRGRGGYNRTDMRPVEKLV